MRALAFVLLFFTLGAVRPAHASLFAEDCARHLPPISVTARIAPMSLALDTEHTLAELNRYHPIPAPWVRLGLTQARPGHQVSVQVPAYRAADAVEFCGSPQVQITVDVNPVTVFVAAEFPRGSCEYRAIYEHEQKHVAVYQSFLYWTSQELARDVQAVVGREFLTATSQDALYATADRLTKRVIANRIGEWLKNLERVQHEVDTPQEYARVAALCPFTQVHRPAHW